MIDVLKKVLYIFVPLILLLPCFGSCSKEDFYFSSDTSELEFSCDTLSFDTVFTQMGTTTRQFKVYNRSDEGVRIKSVTLRNGEASRFRLNVDGDTHMVARNIDIAAGDSIFVFVRANIRPDDQTEPFLIEDAVEFHITSSNVRRMPLTAYGRNAVYHTPTDTLRFADGTYPRDQFGNLYTYSVIDCTNWRHDLPHVVIGYAVVDSRNTLYLKPGDELYFYNNAVLWVYDSATLDVRGSAEQPVLFTSVRHDGWYDDLPGQWGYVWLSAGSRDSYIDHAVIENGYVGILADSCVGPNPTLTISNAQIRNHTLAGLMGQTAYIAGRNLLVTNCGTATVAMQYGGTYSFSGSTFADYWRYDARTEPSVFVTNYRDYGGVHYIWPLQAQLTDCIIYGSRAEGELYIDLDDRTSAEATVTHCLVRGGEWDADPLFVDPDKGDYHLQPNSPAQGIGYNYENQD